MKTQQLLRRAGVIAIGMVGGVGLGYFQDDLTQRLVFNGGPFAPALYIGTALGWIALMIWYGLALRLPALHRFGLRPTSYGLLFLLCWWLATVAGGVAFFLINGMDYMTMSNVVFLATWLGSAYSFVLVALPLLAISAVRAGLPRSAPTPG
jgi:hypothetical protein